MSSSEYKLDEETGLYYNEDGEAFTEDQLEELEGLALLRSEEG